MQRCLQPQVYQRATSLSVLIETSLRSRRLEVVGTRKNGRVSLVCARSLFRPLLPSACYTGYIETVKCYRL